MTDLYNPYGDMSSWYGVPSYGNNYANYMVSQTQPLTLNRIMSMVRDIQQGGSPQALGNPAGNVSQPTQAQIPAAIAQSIFDLNNRLLSVPRMRWEQSGMDIMQPEQEPGGQPGSGIPMPGGGFGGGSGGGGGGGSGGVIGGGGFPSVTMPTGNIGSLGSPTPTSGGGNISTPNTGGINPYFNPNLSPGGWGR